MAAGGPDVQRDMNRVARTSEDGSVIIPSFAASTCVLARV